MDADIEDFLERKGPVIELNCALRERQYIYEQIVSRLRETQFILRRPHWDFEDEDPARNIIDGRDAVGAVADSILSTPGLAEDFLRRTG